MGCDIHLYVEKKHNGKWICINPYSFDLYSDTYDKRKLSSIFDGRNYNLFSWLAQVRGQDDNGFQPKGFPSECSHEIREVYTHWGEDAHNPSYLTLQEIEDKFEGTVTHSGLMEKNQLKKLQKSMKTKKPDYDLMYPYCEMTTVKDHVSFSIEVPLRWSFENFKKEVIDFMKRYTWVKELKDHDKTSVRIVFWFDN